MENWCCHYGDLNQATITIDISWVIFPVVSKRQYQLRQHSEPWALTVFKVLFSDFPWVFGLGIALKMYQLGLETLPFLILYILSSCDSLWEFPSVASYCKNKCLEYSKNWLWKMAAIISPVRCMAPPAMVSWLGLQDQVWVLSYQEDLKFNYIMYNKWKKYFQTPMKPVLL